MTCQDPAARMGESAGVMCANATEIEIAYGKFDGD